MNPDLLKNLNVQSFLEKNWPTLLMGMGGAGAASEFLNPPNESDDDWRRYVPWLALGGVGAGAHLNRTMNPTPVVTEDKKPTEAAAVAESKPWWAPKTNWLGMPYPS